MRTTVQGLNAVIRRPQPMDDAQADRAAFDTAERLLGAPLVLPLGPGEPPSGADFRRLATRHTFGDSWTRTGLDVRSRALVSVTIAATLGTREPLRGQLRIALNNGVTKDEIVDLFIHLEAYAGPPERSTATRSRWRSSRKLWAPSRRPGPQAGPGGSVTEPSAASLAPPRPGPGRFCVGRRPLYGCGSAQPRDGPGVQGQAGACQQVVSIPGASGHGATE